MSIQKKVKQPTFTDTVAHFNTLVHRFQMHLDFALEQQVLVMISKEKKMLKMKKDDFEEAEVGLYRKDP